jgi:YaiO family outer membrane protein
MIVDNALETYPTFEDFLYKKASILNDLKNPAESKAILTVLLNIDPSHQQGLSLLNSIELQGKIYSIGGTYALDMFSRTYNPAHYASIQLSRQNSWGSSIVRFNYANRFNTSGLQSEIDLYPHIANGVYAYLNYGYSNNSIFPTHRAGAEIYSKLPKSMEISGGVRSLNFSSTSNVYIYTGSLGIYFKNYWLSLRPYITPDKNVGTSYSAAVSLRRYWQNSENYLEFNVGAGFSPDERRFQSGTGFTGDNIYILQSQRFNITLQRSLKPTLLILASAGVTRQELIFDTGNYVYITNLSIGLRKKF